MDCAVCLDVSGKKNRSRAGASCSAVQSAATDVKQQDDLTCLIIMVGCVLSCSRGMETCP